MKLRRIMSAMLAAALVTSTVAFAEDIATESEIDINFNVENNKGTYTFTDEEHASYIEYFEDTYDWAENVIFENTEGYIFNNNSQFVIGDSTKFNTDQIYLVEFEAIDIQKDADGNTSFINVGTANMGPEKDQYALAASTLLWCVNPIPELHNTTPSAEDGLGKAVDASRITKYASNFNCDAEIDMLVIWFWYGEDKAEMDVDHSGRERPVIPDKSNWSAEWVFTESGAAMLNEAN
ncbi:MAG: hypothetical protein IJD85_07710, partial [Oscillospiraceae bacterium]|nr:hypothetical protein [Oscillospiraceae bacterium]